MTIMAWHAMMFSGGGRVDRVDVGVDDNDMEVDMARPSPRNSPAQPLVVVLLLFVEFLLDAAAPRRCNHPMLREPLARASGHLGARPWWSQDGPGRLRPANAKESRR